MQYLFLEFADQLWMILISRLCEISYPPSPKGKKKKQKQNNDLCFLKPYWCNGSPKSKSYLSYLQGQLQVLLSGPT